MNETKACPDCGAEFLDHVETCSDCGTTLVLTLPPDPLSIPLSDDLIVVAELIDVISRRFLDALADAGIPHFAGWIETDEGVANHLLLVRPEDETAARQVAAEVEAPTMDLVPLPEGASEEDEAWFDVPDLSPWPEEEAADIRFRASVWIVMASAAALAFAVFGIYGDGPLDTALSWGGGLGVVLGIAWGRRQRAERDRIRQIRESGGSPDDVRS